ncbi:guanylate kinase-like isoform X1 [Anopheles albimanus]|uniref:guanylate kinase-like isoform X1 n=2 Tax=Anopheles albimanus TaxID=7167 RepID=UPI00164201E9|nr:guanylate kinase-like isoform X1 [Anopheles albimanus]
MLFNICCRLPVLRSCVNGNLICQISLTVPPHSSQFFQHQFLAAKAFSHLTKMVKQGPRPLVICGPSGSGKSTLLKKLFKEFPDTFGFSVSHTTRKPRPGEENGIHYHFVSVEEMQAAIEKGEFIETAVFSGNMYGTSKKAVENVQHNGKVCVLDIEIEGVKQIRNSERLNPLLVFVNPPSIEELERRLRGRQTETEESLQKRLNTARIEIEYGTTPGNFDVVVQNNTLTQAYDDLRDFIVRELETQQSQDVFCVTSLVSNYKSFEV